MQMSRVLIVGCGYVGLELAKQRRKAGDPPMFALTRSEARVDELQSQGLEPIVGHWHSADSLVLPAVDTILISVPHREDREQGIESHIHGLKSILQKVPAGWSKLIYLSTTGVYGDAHDVVDESTPTQPARIGPQIAVATELFLRQTLSPEQLTIVRLAGIYGPGRIPLADKLRTGAPLQVPQDGWLNLAHVSDIARMLTATLATRMEHSLYVFSDGNPVPRLEFYQYLANLCGVSEPKFMPPDPSSSRSQRAGNKRVNPDRILRELSFTFSFPNYREGLIDCLSKTPFAPQ
jgi:nucleoside-diphosphate-sugar epimerase